MVLTFASSAASSRAFAAAARSFAISSSEDDIFKTLDVYDRDYIADYFNHDDSEEFKKAHGFNYHNGPEWV